MRKTRFLKMPGYFETVVADAVRQGGTVYKLSDNVSPYGFKFLSLANVMLVSSEPHTAGNTGPVTAGWTNFGASGSQKTFDLTALFPGRLPSSTSSIVIHTTLTLTANAASIETNIKVNIDNNNNAILGSGLSGNGNIAASFIGAVSNRNDEVVQSICPWNPTNPVLNITALWTNTAAPLAQSAFVVRVIGYNSN